MRIGPRRRCHRPNSRKPCRLSLNLARHRPNIAQVGGYSGKTERSAPVELPDTQFYRGQAKKCRQLAKVVEELRRELFDLAAECDQRAQWVAERPKPGLSGPSPLPPKPQERSEPLTYSIKEAARLLGLGRTTIYRLIGEGRLDTVKIGNRTLIKLRSMQRLAGSQD